MSVGMSPLVASLYSKHIVPMLGLLDILITQQLKSDAWDQDSPFQVYTWGHFDAIALFKMFNITLANILGLFPQVKGSH